MTKFVTIAKCVAIVTAIESGEVVTSAIMDINGNTTKHRLSGEPHQFEVGKTYEVSFFPAAEEPQTDTASSTETSDAPVSEEKTGESAEPMKEAA